MKKSLHLPLLIIALFASLGCEKPEDRPCSDSTHVRTVPTFFYDYIFQDTSQWIYTSAIDSMLDTVTMWNLTRSWYEWETAGGTGNMTGGCPTVRYEEEQYVMWFHSTRSGDFYESIIRERIYRSGRDGGIALWEGAVGSTLEQAIIEAVHDSMVIHGHTFEHVTQVWTIVGSVVEPGLLTLYYCPDVGVVRTDVRWGDSLYNRLDLLDWNVKTYAKQW